jgi:hypothetical protein
MTDKNLLYSYFVYKIINLILPCIIKGKPFITLTQRNLSQLLIIKINDIIYEIIIISLHFNY